VVNQSQPGVNNKVTGVQIQAALQKHKQQILLEMRIQNGTQSVLNVHLKIKDFALKINSNSFGLQPQGLAVTGGPVPSAGGSASISKELAAGTQQGDQPLTYPLKLQVYHILLC
jgi:hypothetical protein